MKKIIVLSMFLLSMFLLTGCSTCPIPTPVVKEKIVIKHVTKIVKVKSEHLKIGYPNVSVGKGCKELKESFEQCYKIIKEHNHVSKN